MSQTVYQARRKMFTPEHELYRDSVARFLAEKVMPHHAQWEEKGLVPRDLWRAAGAHGLLCPGIPEHYGGGGGDFLHSAIVVEEIARALASGVTGFTTHSENVAPYLLEFGTEAQKQTFLPKMASGEVVGSIAMTEPGAGSDLKAIRTSAVKVDGGYRVSGQKTFITNGYHADRVLVFTFSPNPIPPPARAASACSGWTPPPRASAAGACSTNSARRRKTPPSCFSTTSSCPKTCSSARPTRASPTP